MNNDSTLFRLVGIKTTEFAKFEQVYLPDTEYEVGVQLGFATLENQKIVEVNTRIVFELKNNPVLLIAVSCFFEIQAWDNYYNKDANALVVPKNVAQHFAVLTIGTTRGVLHAKTEGLVMNTLIIPTINVTELVPKDIVISPVENLKDEEKI
jgi:hypothetical protein